jgi:formylglycine-generating enzyme required for sulfatase activity
MAQGGNVWEWNETEYDGTSDTVGEVRQLRGGSWGSGVVDLRASNRNNLDPANQNSDNGLGFRVASVPEPSALSLLAIGLGILFRRSRKRD